MKTYQFCPFDGEKLVKKEIDGKKRRTCQSCGYIDYQNARAGATVIIENDKGEILLVKRAIEPFSGRWDIPGGFVDLGENPFDTAKREAKEETGYDVEIKKLIGIGTGWYDHPVQGSFPTLHIGFAAKIVGGSPKTDHEGSDLRFFPKDNLPEIPFEGDKQVLKKYLEEER